ncbi:Protease synthase and sporulation protein PAI 2 [Microbulbifer aggregans]|uniref:Protease synthase and sporulation protein PAI 2 n=1 Tax=Microbulbifer aggregans TaxID=1769779 RepID=A0A1C9W4L6_9GAMM|nr:FMN-binding negative transcriptional regulator [Microbulbifer aggregans]AOS96089.1 Protease synthase and sporulation protein PAI 2 [Microbulbifer aggregans]
MYIPTAFEITDQEEIYAFVEKHGFGQLISSVAGRLTSTHMPFLLSEERAILLGHLARSNPQCTDLHGQEVLVTLQGHHGYISPSWYEKPGVPTWNYQAVHIYGRALVFDCRERLKQVVDRLSQKYEGAIGQEWRGDYEELMLGAIMGVEINISEVQCTYKLSQNRSAEDRQGVISQLKELGSNELAEVMEKYNV